MFQADCVGKVAAEHEEARKKKVFRNKKHEIRGQNVFYLTFELRSANLCNPVDFRYLPIDSELGGTISRL